mgnify:FL=1
MRIAAIALLLVTFLFIACSGTDDQECKPNDHTICREGVIYWVDSCGNEGNKADECDCGCNSDYSGCEEPCDCVPACDGKECGPNGCGGNCPPGCSAGEECADNDTCVPATCDSVAQSVAGVFDTSVSSLEFQSGTVELKHKRDVDEFEDGCIYEISLVLRHASGCEMNVTAGRLFNENGALEVLDFSFSADSQCPNFPDQSEGVYVDIGGLNAGVHSSVSEVPGDNVAASCVETQISLDIEGTIADTQNGTELSIEPSTIVLNGVFPSTGDEAASCPAEPSCDGVTCEQPGEPNQGPDQDGDGWGDCCDCDDQDAAVNPGANEIIHNRKDDDCDPSTPDSDYPGDPDDRDDDGYLSQQAGGDDCDDLNADINPGAEERCNGLDDDCDGVIDGPDVCTSVDGGIDGGDEEPECTDISGVYDIRAACLQISDAYGVEFVQDGCSISFNLDAIYCTGTVDAAMNLYVSCAGLGFPCSGQASLTESFTLVCSEQCTFVFEPLGSATACSFHTDPDCLADGQLCGVVGQNGEPRTVCVATIPGGREPGFYCDPAADRYCSNSLCLDGACGGLCTGDAHCQDYPGTSCQTELYSDADGNQGNIQVCLPEIEGQTRCGRSSDCSPARLCSYRQRDADVVTVCEQPNGNGAEPGQACTTSEECLSGICVCGDELCDGSTAGVCSAICQEDGDCINSQRCDTIYIPDLTGTHHAIGACVPDPEACSRNADCGVGKSCQAFITPDNLLQTQCMYGAGDSVDNTGEPCQNSTDCFSVWCNDVEHFCNGLCLSDMDCPTYQDSPSDCQSDAECTLEELCHAGGCKRAFECATRVFITGTDDYGQDIYQTLNMCRPIRRACELPADCRAGEACTIDNNETATAAGYACRPGHGPGELGDDCTQGGSDSCWSGLCVHAGDSGEAYCSQACTTGADCGPVEDCDNPDITCWGCQAIRIDIRPGYVSYLPTCIRL